MDFTREELLARLAALGVNGVTGVVRYGSGHINDTYRVDTAAGEALILQRVNTSIFTDGETLRETVLRVTRHLAAKGVRSLEVVAYEHPWRIFRFLDGYTSRDRVTDPGQALATARAFAKFQDDLADLPAPRLKEILPRFHDTPDRLRQLDEASAADVKGRRAAVARELACVGARRAGAGAFVSMMAAGELPERITHNDTKINNVLVAPDGGAVVIDLDTVMPGTALSDFGDMVRTATATAAEDEADLSRVGSSRECFRALARGYLEGAGFLTAVELDNLVFAGRLSTFEVGVRFLTDYLAGDTYFHTAYPEHNLVRARNQFRMVEALEDADADYRAIVAGLRAAK